jgi:hypothetical protein
MAVVVGAALLAGCGAGPEAGRLARQERALLAAVPGDDASVRAALADQADAWAALEGLLARQVPFGVPASDAFRARVREVAALSRRQRALIAAGEDDAASNRAALSHLAAMWAHVGRYLGE